MKLLKINSRIRLLTTLALLTYIYLIAANLYSKKNYFKMGSNTEISTYFIDVSPNDSMLHFPFDLENKVTHEQISVQPIQMMVHNTRANEKSKKVKIEKVIKFFLDFSFMIIIFYVPFAIRRLLKSLKSGNFFRYENQQNFRRTGKIFSVTFFITLAADIINYDINKTLFSFTEFIISREKPSFIWLICGILFLIFAEILRNGIALREENELTV